MSRVVIVGGHGKIALLLSRLLSDRGDSVVGVVRSASHGDDLSAAGAETAVLDVESADAVELSAVLAGADAVVFAAGAGGGSGPERKRTVDLGGSLLAQEAARLADVRRLVQISAIGVDDPTLAERGDETWAAYVAAKRDADAALRRTDLEWTIVRPGSLTDDAGTGRVSLADETPRGSVPRADVAAVVAELLRTGAGPRRTLDLIGGDVPVEDAVAALS